MSSTRRFFIAGLSSCVDFHQTRQALTTLENLFPSKVSVEIKEYQNDDDYQKWLTSFRPSLNASHHSSSPLVWTDGNKYVGGKDAIMSWLQKSISPNFADEDIAPHESFTDEWSPDHSYDYDLVVIGGGSGGLACSKEAKLYGARVAVLDFVKPSSHGSKWGLGGTCVNVGCIPKKLMHTAALLGEASNDAIKYGWSEPSAAPTHSWETMRERVQDHIRGLNFNYRVTLREKGVTYLNKLGKFVDNHTIECVDAKGNKSTVTSARFVIAVGGRPTPLDIPGGELAITSDDLFSLENAPGKTCVVGAGYVALECAGFISGLHQGDVVVLVRSVPLRGFDRDLAERVQSAMENHGTQIIVGVVPTSIEKLPSGKLLVSYSNGESGEFDTVLAAVGRYADTRGLGLDAVNISVNPRNGKIACVNEQTPVPNIYAIGDVVEGVPELTPSAIMAGRMLARRLFAGETELMNYKNIATTVFTPLELGTVGYSEEEAIEKFGEDSVDCYMSSFQPLEWSIPEKATQCIAKVVVNTQDNERVLGIHIAAPNAGEIIQGFSTALKKGLYYKDLLTTVGIHPTTAEEFTVMEVSKSSGASFKKGGC